MVPLLMRSRLGRRLLLAALAGAAALVALAVLAVSSLVTAAAASSPLGGVSCPVEGVAVGDGDGDTGLTGEQIKNAQAIILTGQQMRVPVRGQVVAIATALQESTLRNLNHGDRDSVGLFQQRPSQGWGTVEELTTPRISARKFYEKLLQVRGWEQMPVTKAAQAVQRSGFPDAYAKHERRAVQIVTSLSTGDLEQAVDTTGCVTAADAPDGATRTALATMLDQVGKPYKWGATGPDAFDCSGLIVYGWRQAGYRVNVRTSQQMYDVSTPVKAGKERPGDLIYTEFQSGGPAHVMVVIRPGLTIEAPRTGVPVRVREYDAAKEHAKIGRLPSSVMTH